MLDEAVIEAARSLAETEGYGYQTVINNTLRHALLSKTGQSAGSAQLKKGITASVGEKAAGRRQRNPAIDGS